MDLELTETQSLLQETVSSYLEQEVPFDRIRELEREGRSDDVLWKGVCEQGWLGISVGEAHGGAGESLVDLGLVVEAVAKRAAIVPLLEVAVCARTIERHADAARAEALLEQTLSGDAIVVPAVLEDDDRFGSSTARVDAEGRLHGHKCFVDHAAFATHHLVVADDGEGRGLFLVDARDAGVSATQLENVGWTPKARVEYDGVAAEAIARGESAVADVVRLARALAAVQVAASMARALEDAVEYAKVREQFGTPIGSFQAVRHHCANMASKVASARLLAFEALSALNEGHDDDRLVAAAKASSSRAAPEVTMLAHQVFGGNGVILENDHYFFTLRARERALAWGTADECMAVMAEHIETPHDWL